MPSHQRSSTPGVVKLERKLTATLPHREIDNVVLPKTELKTEGCTDTSVKNLKVEVPSPAVVKRKLEYVDKNRQEPEDILITGQKQGKKRKGDPYVKLEKMLDNNENETNSDVHVTSTQPPQLRACTGKCSL